MPSRRGFLSFLGAAVASATLDPERLLWVPGAKVYSIPVVRYFRVPFNVVPQTYANLDGGDLGRGVHTSIFFKIMTGRELSALPAYKQQQAIPATQWTPEFLERIRMRQLPPGTLY